jgi:hypothetical protein
MKRAALVLAGFSLCAAPALGADRLTDKDVKQLVSKIEQGRDKFDDALDDKLKHKILRGPNGEVNVDNYMNDFQKNIDQLEERIKPEYAASAEAATLLRQASQIDAFFRQQPSGTKGESEWNRLAVDLKTLAAAYGADFPLPDKAPVRRIGDNELAKAIEQIAEGGKQLKKSLDTDLKKDKTMPKPTREDILAGVDQFSKDAKALRSRVNDGKPSSAEAKQLLADAGKLQAAITDHKASASSSVFNGIASHLNTVASAYRENWGGTR